MLDRALEMAKGGDHVQGLTGRPRPELSTSCGLAMKCCHRSGPLNLTSRRWESAAYRGWVTSHIAGIKTHCSTCFP
jgi:hypothetical protein